ncbi:hypothetical protein HPB48_021782 [Haemaphysalis longicornis]|uniref:Protein kinase domain-containing protein n=1 Tax=Haemaphysalis longicornis TaxID=44386 RepID=A0A9J6FVJ1_HAELO|nr:hypothetical protein HPB48_021782 [Haemaphysalis longicornis]
MFDFVAMAPKNHLGKIPTNDRLDEDIVRSYLRETLYALMFSDMRRVLHSDLKSPNLLVHKDIAVDCAVPGRALGILLQD